MKLRINGIHCDCESPAPNLRVFSREAGSKRRSTSRQLPKPYPRSLLSLVQNQIAAGQACSAESD